jgi:ABC-type uncharacterized transport system ATPase subunit
MGVGSFMRVEIDHITKVFGKVRASDDISLTFDDGRIYAILGENGAGKSTLMKILSGYQPPDSGYLAIDSKKAVFESPADALAVGIGMLHQDPLDVPNLTVLENFMLGGKDKFLPDRRAARKALSEIAGSLGFSLNPESFVDSLTIGERQQLEIVRLLHLGARVLILDEPTTGISADQKDILFASLRRLAHADDLTVILVSHKLEDVEALCETVYVLRHGKVAGAARLPFPVERLVAMMFGKDLERPARQTFRREGKTKNTVLNVKALSVPGRRVALKDVYLEVEAGEVIGMAGLDGSGQSAFLRACAGLQRPNMGAIYLAGQDITSLSYHARARLGIAYAPAGRLEEGLVSGLTLAEHFALVAPNGYWVDWKAAQRTAEARIEHFNIRGEPRSQVQTLSGGNQQRTLLALLPPDLKLLLLESPTRGLDIESTRWIWQQLLERRAKGSAIIFSSPDLDEILDHSDRIAVFFGGRITLINDPANMPRADLVGMIGGV